MKITVNVECTPEEARTFMGLPDVQPIQRAVLEEMEKQMVANVRSLSPETVMNNWVPASLQGAEQIQKLFWNQIQHAVGEITNATASAMVTFTDPKKEK